MYGHFYYLHVDLYNFRVSTSNKSNLWRPNEIVHAVRTLLMKFYRLDANWKINMTSLVFLIATIPITFLVSFVLKRFGLKWSVSIYSILTCIGAWIRLIGIQVRFHTFHISFLHIFNLHNLNDNREMKLHFGFH